MYVVDVKNLTNGETKEHNFSSPHPCRIKIFVIYSRVRNRSISAKRLSVILTYYVEKYIPTLKQRGAAMENHHT